MNNTLGEGRMNAFDRKRKETKCQKKEQGEVLYGRIADATNRY